MTLEFECPECGETLRVADEHAGRRAMCKYCQAKITVPLFDDDEEDEAPVRKPAPRPKPAPAPEPVVDDQFDYVRPKKKRKKRSDAGLWIGLGLGGLAIALMVGLVVVTQMNKASNNRKYIEVIARYTDNIREFSAALSSVRDRKTSEQASTRIVQLTKEFAEIYEAEKKLVETRTILKSTAEKAKQDQQAEGQRISGSLASAAANLNTVDKLEPVLESIIKYLEQMNRLATNPDPRLPQAIASLRSALVAIKARQPSDPPTQLAQGNAFDPGRGNPGGANAGEANEPTFPGETLQPGGRRRRPGGAGGPPSGGPPNGGTPPSVEDMRRKAEEQIRQAQQRALQNAGGSTIKVILTGKADAVGDRLVEIVRYQGSGHSFEMQSSGNRAEGSVGPVSDIDEFIKCIDFGRVTRHNNDSVEIRVTAGYRFVEKRGMVLNDQGKAVPFASLDKDLVKKENPEGGNEGKSEEPSPRQKRAPKSGTTTPTKKGDTYVVVFDKDYNEDEIVDRLEEIVEQAGGKVLDTTFAGREGRADKQFQVKVSQIIDIDEFIACIDFGEVENGSDSEKVLFVKYNKSYRFKAGKGKVFDSNGKAVSP